MTEVAATLPATPPIIFMRTGEAIRAATVPFEAASAALNGLGYAIAHLERRQDGFSPSRTRRIGEAMGAGVVTAETAATRLSQFKSVTEQIEQVQSREDEPIDVELWGPQARFLSMGLRRGVTAHRHGQSLYDLRRERDDSYPWLRTAGDYLRLRANKKQRALATELATRDMDALMLRLDQDEYDDAKGALVVNLQTRRQSYFTRQSKR